MAITQVGPGISYAHGSLNGINASGQVFCASNIAVGTPAAGTGVTWVAAVTQFADTQPTFIIQNADQKLSIDLIAIKMSSSAVATSATLHEYAGVLDTAARSVTTNHLAAAAVFVPNSNLSSPPNFQMPTVSYQTGTVATVIAASSLNSRLVSRGNLGGLNVAGDVFMVKFGSFEGMESIPLTAVQATGVGTRKASDGPVRIAPGHSYTFTMWAVGQAAALNPDFHIWMAAVN